MGLNLGQDLSKFHCKIGDFIIKTGSNLIDFNVLKWEKYFIEFSDFDNKFSLIWPCYSIFIFVSLFRDFEIWLSNFIVKMGSQPKSIISNVVPLFINFLEFCQHFGFGLGIGHDFRILIKFKAMIWCFKWFLALNSILRRLWHNIGFNFNQRMFCLWIEQIKSFLLNFILMGYNVNLFWLG